MTFPAWKSVGLQRSFRRSLRFARKLPAILASERFVPVPLEGLQWALIQGGRPSSVEMPAVQWRDVSASSDEFNDPTLLMTDGAQVTYQLNLPEAFLFETKCRKAKERADSSSVRFTVTVSPLTGIGADVHKEVTVTGTDEVPIRLDLKDLQGQRVKLTLQVKRDGGPQGVSGWIDPRIMYVVKRPSRLQRLNYYLSAKGAERLRRNLSLVLTERRYGGPKTAVLSSPENAPALQSTLSILLITDGRRPDLLRRAVESAVAQSSSHWELMILLEAAVPLEELAWLQERATSNDRIRLVCGDDACGTAELLNKGLHSTAAGSLVATLRDTDTLMRGAVEGVLSEFARSPQTDWIYTDEEYMDEPGLRLEIRHKPAWGRDSLLSGLLPGRWCICRREAALGVGGYREGSSGAEEYDLILRLIDSGKLPRHLPVVLYRTHLPVDESAARSVEAEREMGQAFLARNNVAARINPEEGSPYSRTKYRIEGTPLVSIILPTNGSRPLIDGKQVDLLANCVRSILSKTDYPHFEVLCVDNANLQSETLAAIAALNDPRVRVISFTRPFNLADKFNWAVGQAKGEHLLLLNDDIEVRTDEWLAAMLEFSQQTRVGAVGAKLYYPGGEVQHVGVVFVNGLPHHRARKLPGDVARAMPELSCIRNYSVVTGACMMTRREVYEQVGGWDPLFYLNFNDVDYCLKVRAKGYEVVFTPYAQLVHYESITRGPGSTVAEDQTLTNVWGSQVTNDPDEQPSAWARDVAFNWLKG